MLLLKIGMTGGGTNTSVDIHKLLTKTLLSITIVIFGLDIARFNTSINKGTVQWIAHIITGTNSYRSFTAGVLTGDSFMSLQFFKIRQAILIIPTTGTMGFPLIIIMGIAPHIDHAINRRSPTHHLTSRAIHYAIIEIGLGDRLKAPVVLISIHWNTQSGGHTNKHTVITTTIFNQQHLSLRILTQSRGNNYASRACPHHNVVVVFMFLHGFLYPIPKHSGRYCQSF